MVEASSCKSEQSSLEKVTEAMATTSPPQKSKVTVPPVDTSSQASMEEAEGSLEGIPANISLIAAVYSSRSASPPVDPLELQANANSHWQHASSQKVPRCQEAESHLGIGGNVALKWISWGYIDHSCQGHLFPCNHGGQNQLPSSCHGGQDVQIPFDSSSQGDLSKAISDTKAQTTSQAVMFQEEHRSYLQDLEEQALGEESRSCQDVLSSCQAALCYSLQSIRGALAASYHLLLGQTPPSPPLI